MNQAWIDDMVKAHRKMIQDKIDAERRKRRDDRPPYINHGDLSLVDFREKFRRRRTRAFFPPLSGNRKNGVIIPGLKTRYIPIMGASPATYFLRQDGEQTNLALATGPGDTVGSCANIATHDADAGSDIVAGDTFKICDDGGIFRSWCQPPEPGTGEEARITYEPEAGDSPKFYGSDLIASGSSWTLDSGSIYYADFGATAPHQVWFSKSGVIHWGDEQVSKVACAAEYDWYYDGSQYLYVYAPSDPDGIYDWVECTVRDYCFGKVSGSARDYLTINDIEFAFSQDAGIRFVNSDYLIIDGVTSHHNAENKDLYGRGVDLYSSNNCTVKNSILHNNGYQGVFVISGGGDSSDCTIEYVIAYDNYHSNIDFINSGGGTMDGGIVRYNLSYFTTDWTPDVAPSIPYYWEGGSGNIVTNFEVYYNVAVRTCGAAYNPNQYCTNFKFYNNIGYDQVGSYNAGGINIGGNCSGMDLKNNILVDTGDHCLAVPDETDISECNYNLWYQSAGGVAVYVSAGGQQFHYDDEASFVSNKASWGWGGDNQLWEDPDWLDTSNDNFHLKTESPCINAGVSVGLEGSNDYYGRLIRPGDAIDIGCSQTLKGGPRRL